VDKNWRPKPGTYHTVKVDTFCVGYGFVPSVELTRLAECNIATSRSSAAGFLFAITECRQRCPMFTPWATAPVLQGSLVAIEKAELQVWAQLGGLDISHRWRPGGAWREQAAPAGLQRLRKVLDRISVPRPGLYELQRMIPLCAGARRSL